MREIKFRVWNNSSKNFETTDFAIRNDGPYILTYDWHNNHAKSWGSPYDTFIVQQYTGLKDKNGIEIYEGDICNAGMVTGPIDFIIGSFSLASNPLIEFMPKDTCVFSPDFDPSWIDVEVIGNIFENKDLLEKEL